MRIWLIFARISHQKSNLVPFRPSFDYNSHTIPFTPFITTFPIHTPKSYPMHFYQPNQQQQQQQSSNTLFTTSIDYSPAINIILTTTSRPWIISPSPTGELVIKNSTPHQNMVHTIALPLFSIHPTTPSRFQSPISLSISYRFLNYDL